MKHEHIDLEEFKEKMDEGGYELVDLRTPVEFETGHLEGAYNIDFTEPECMAFIEQMEKNKKAK